ncbi:c-type cytochrome biogenesis protein CcmI [Roseospira navarrensis]|uniref:C-type cytochrome biogenesis protein CcmI n=1 Tax=Roseospira navarrensis TaxID=140058 RepID=A0A7X1ZEV6_9PROT|nr:c-type cytochrome biogenesis protein CcmI [Roseospira navarrensis]MQX36122.1 c-type cytochrome biogenesis protein CcmI [Roseospira navarrensis]
MIVLWLMVALFSALVMAMLMFPLLTRTSEDKGGSADRAEYDLTVYKDQLSEIDRDLARGLLSEDQAAAARLEVQRRMLAATGGPDGAKGEGDGAATKADAAPIRMMDLIPRAIEQGPWGIATLAGVIAVVPMGALALYLVIGSPMLPGQPHAQRIALAAQESMAALPDDLRETIEMLQAVVEQRPEEAQAWFELGRAYRRAEQHGLAVEALDRARELGVGAEDQPTLISELAESRLLSEQGQMTPRVRGLFLEALRLDRTEPRARFYLGMAAAQDGEPARALAIWRDLSAESPQDAPWMGMLRQSMSMVAQQNGIMPASVKPAHPLDLEAGAPVERIDPPAAPEGSAQGGGSAEGGPTPGAQMRAEADAGRAPGQGFSEDERAMIEGMVEGLAARLEENPDDVEGWMRLAQSYGVLGRWDDAVAASARALDQAPEDPDVLEGHADTLIAAAQAAGEPDPPEAVFGLFDTLLESRPDHPKALYFVGLGAAKDGNVDRARSLWERLLARIPEGEPAHAAIQRQLDALPSSADATQ